MTSGEIMGPPLRGGPDPKNEKWGARFQKISEKKYYKTPKNTEKSFFTFLLGLSVSFFIGPFGTHFTNYDPDKLSNPYDPDVCRSAAAQTN